MKLQYYLRGLGIGIIVTALIMGLSDRNVRPLTDAEIKAKAATLGMVESDSLTLTDVSASPEAAKMPAVTADPVMTAAPTEAPTVTPTATPTESPVVTPTPVPKPKMTAEPVVTAAPTAETVAISVKSGSGSETVCRQLEEAGLIESAAAFNQYLVDNGYSKRICVGTFEIHIGAAEEEIAKIITKTR